MASNPFAVDWTNRHAVIEYAKQLNEESDTPLVVFKHPGRRNYNITFFFNTSHYKPEWVIFRP